MELCANSWLFPEGVAAVTNMFKPSPNSLHASRIDQLWREGEGKKRWKPYSFIFETKETEYGKRAESFDRQFSILGSHNPSGRAKASAFSCPDLLPNRKQRIINSSTATIYLRASSCKLSVIVLVLFTSQEWHNHRLKSWEIACMLEQFKTWRQLDKEEE